MLGNLMLLLLRCDRHVPRHRQAPGPLEGPTNRLIKNESRALLITLLVLIQPARCAQPGAAPNAEQMRGRRERQRLLPAPARTDGRRRGLSSRFPECRCDARAGRHGAEEKLWERTEEK